MHVFSQFGGGARLRHGSRYTLVAVDGRGTGGSGPLRCPMLLPAHLEATAPAAECAKALGPRRDFYGTADHAEDLEAVRAALGYDSVALYGVSYGTELALAYALAHPGRVDRLLLDSVSLPRATTLPHGLLRTLARDARALLRERRLPGYDEGLRGRRRGGRERARRGAGSRHGAPAGRAGGAPSGWTASASSRSSSRPT
jgi:pimeloyl-ACP methyl ester carboxylesterase